MKWGIVVTWGERGLTCCGWMPRTDEVIPEDPREFDNKADAEQFIAGEIQYDIDHPDDYPRVMTPREFVVQASKPHLTIVKP